MESTTPFLRRILRPLALSACAVAMPGAVAVPDAEAGLIVAPVRRTAMVTAVASSSANANAAAAANANAAAASANAAAAASRPSDAPPPVGTIVTALPPECAQIKLNEVDYLRCGSTYYKAAMMGNNLVFVVTLP